MKNLLKLMIFSVLITEPVLAQHTIGSGGDYIRQIFQDARAVAVLKLHNYNNCDEKINENVKNWITDNTNKLVNDIMNSPHFWVVDTQPTCAYSGFNLLNGPIYLSYPTCSPLITNIQTASQLLIEQSMNHMGLNNSLDIQKMVGSINENKSCSIEPEPFPKDLFDSKICQGNNLDFFTAKNLFPAGALTISFNQYAIQSRTRNCTEAQGCSDWTSTKICFDSDCKEEIKNVSLTLSAINSNPFYKSALSLVSKNSKMKIDMKEDQSLVLNSDLYLKKQSEFSRVKQNSQFTGNIKEHCSWFNLIDKKISEDKKSWSENQIVIYGQQKK